MSDPNVHDLAGWASDDEEDLSEEPPILPKDYLDFLSTDPRGPGLDIETIELLSLYGMVDVPRLVMFSQYPFSHLLAMLTTSELQGISRIGFRNLVTYGTFIQAHDLITDDDHIQVTELDPLTYKAIRKSQRRQSASNFRTSFQAEMDSRTRARSVGGARKSATDGSDSPSTRGGDEHREQHKRFCVT